MNQMVTYRGRIRLFDKIAHEGVKLLEGDYLIGRHEITRPDGIIVRGSKIRVEEYPGLKIVVRAGSGVNTINVAKATQLGIVVANTADGNAPSVAELTFNMLGGYFRPLNASRAFVASHAGDTADALKKAIDAEKSKYTGRELRGLTLGIIGVGHIGKLVAKIARAYGMDVIGFDIKRSSIKGFRWAGGMNELFAAADVISVHVPYMKGRNDAFIGKDQLALMRPGSILINTARDELIDHEAVLEALRTPDAPLSAYLTDFPTPEIIGAEGVMCTPHLGASTIEAGIRCAVSAAQQVREYLEYGNIINSVNMPNVVFPFDDTTRTRLAIFNRNIPDMIGKITHIVGVYGHNIQGMTNVSRDGVGYNLIDFEEVIPDMVVGEIAKHEGIIRARVIRFPHVG